MFAMIAMVLSVTAVLANSFAGQLVAGEGVTTDFAVETSGPDEVAAEPDESTGAPADETGATPAESSADG